VLLLPYREAYTLRVSRLMIEALVHGIPVLVTRGTTLAEQSEQFGVFVPCENENVESLVAAIETVERDFDALAAKAREHQAKAREYFSVKQFRRLLKNKRTTDQERNLNERYQEHVRNLETRRRWR
jgi:glycosyltransferase involved in cell wall biosynthesis